MADPIYSIVSAVVKEITKPLFDLIDDLTFTKEEKARLEAQIKTVEASLMVAFFRYAKTSIPMT